MLGREEQILGAEPSSKYAVWSGEYNCLMSEEPEETRVFCNGCKSETNHVLNAKHERTEEYPLWVHEPTEIERWVYRMWVCAGCDRATLEIQRFDWLRGSLGKPEIEYFYFPKRKRSEHQPKLFKKLPEKLERIYKEAVHAFNEKLHILCAAGLRALIEGICADKGLEGANLEKKIEGLKTLLPENIVKNIHSFRFIGNDAVHELKPPTAVDLRLAIEVSEDLLNFLYDLDYKTERLALRRQERVVKAKAAGETAAEIGLKG